MLRIRFTFAVLAIVLAISPARAALFTVTSTSDGTDIAPGDGVCDANPSGAVVCTLRAAVQEANALAGADGISLPAGTHTLTLAGVEDVAAAGDLDVSSVITIAGTGATSTTIHQTAPDRVFEVWFAPAALTLSGVTVSGGNPGTEFLAMGGGIRNLALLTLDDVNVTGNVAGLAAGIFNFGEIHAVDLVVAGNEATVRIGGIASASYSASGGPGTNLSLDDSTIGPNASFGDPMELELANGNAAVLTNVTVSPVDTNRFSIDAGNLDATFHHVTSRGGFRTYSHDGSHSLTFSNSAFEWCSLGSSLPVIARIGVNASVDDDCGFVAAGGIASPLLLGALGDNGGPTPTFLPQAGSPLIGAASTAECLAADQRGVARPQGAACDIGAVEVVPEPSAIAAVLAAIASLAVVRLRF